MSKEKEIIFTLEPNYKHLVADIYSPIPAIKEIPDWYKNMATSIDSSTVALNVDTKTIKRCMPVFDAMTTGYLLKTFTDIHFYTDENNNLQWHWAIGMGDKKAVEPHPAYQLMNYREIPNLSGAPKFINPWGIITPKGYSCLFINPPHRPDWGGRILEGLVDTDEYHTSVNFPFLFHEREKTIPAGTPIALVLPFKRDSWQMKIGGEVEQKKMQETLTATLSLFVHGYKSLYRKKKEFK